MMNGHGDDAPRYPHIRVDFASSVARQPALPALYAHLAQRLPLLAHYPEPDAASLEGRIAAHLGVRPEEVLATAGATAAIYLIAQALRGARSAILQPTFAEYADACRMHAHTVLSFFSPEALPSAADVLWVCSPNNPTGAVVRLPGLRCVADRNGQRPRRTMRSRPKGVNDPLLVCDQSYAAFTEQPLLTPREAIDRGNALLLRSLTKTFGVPGLRLGYIIGSAPLLGHLRSFRMPWAISPLAMAAAQYLLDHRSAFAIDARAISRERERVQRALPRLAPVTPWPSHSHLLLCQMHTGRAAPLKQWLAREHGLLIRDASNFEGLSDAFFRIALQRPQENDLLLQALPQWFA